MSDVNIRSCDGCPTPLTGEEDGMKVVSGSENQFPPSRLFDYCPACTVPPLKELAKAKPGFAVLSVEILRGLDWHVLWEGRVMYDSEKEVFTDGYEKILNP